MENLPAWRICAPAAQQPTIAVAGRKGGQGKTTTAVSVAACLALVLDKVLPGTDPRFVAMIDADTQKGSLTEWMPPQWHDVPPEKRYALKDVLCRDVPLDEAVWPTTLPRLHMVPGGRESAQFEQMRIPGQDFVLRNKLAQADRPCAAWVIDCGPSLTMLPINGMIAARRLVMPVRIGTLDLVGADELYGMVSEIRQQELAPDLEVAAVVLTAVLRSGLRNQMVERLTAGFPGTPLAEIRHTVRAGEAPGLHQPLALSDPRGTATLDYWNLAKILYPEVLRG